MLSLGPSIFDGFSAESFDAYEERKWSSNRFNLERMRAREQLVALADAVLTDARALELHLAKEATHDHPTLFNNKKVDAQWVFFSRPESERLKLATYIDREHSLQNRISDSAPHHNHAILAFRLNLTGLTLLFGVHRNGWVDIQNLVNKCKEETGRDQFLELLHALPEEASFSGNGKQASAHNASSEDLASILPMEEDAEIESDWLECFVQFSRDDPRLVETSLVEEIEPIIEALLPLYVFSAWSEENDCLGMTRIMKEEEKARRIAVGNVEVGCIVRLKTGLFSGRKGKVLELDHKGSAKILLGTMTVKAEARDLHRL